MKYKILLLSLLGIHSSIIILADIPADQKNKQPKRNTRTELMEGVDDLLAAVTRISGLELDADIVELNKDVSELETAVYTNGAHGFYTGSLPIETRIEKLENNTTSIDRKTTEIDNEITALSSNAITINNSIANINSTISSMNNTIASINNDTTSLCSESSGVFTRIETLENNSTQDHQKIVTIDHQITDLQSNVITLNNSLANVATKITTINDNASNVNNILTTITGNILGIDMRTGALENNAITINNDISHLNSDLSTTNILIKTVNDEISTIHHDLSTVENKISELDAQTETLEGNVTTMNNGVAIINDNIVTLNEGIAIINDGVSTLNQEIVTIHNELTTHGSSLVAVTNTITSLQTTLYTSGAPGVYTSSIPLETRITNLEHNGTNINASSFNGILSNTDTTLQQALHTVDQWGTMAANHNVLIGQGSHTPIAGVLPTLHVGIPLVSQGLFADPTYSTAVVAGGGTGNTTLTQHGVLLGEGTSAIAATAAGSNGQILVGSTNTDPAFITPTAGNGLTITSNATTLQYALSTPVSITNGGTGVATLAAYTLLAGGTTSTGAVQSLTSGNHGDILISNGADTLPSWVSPTVQTSIITLTNAQVRNLGTTPITIINAPGAGKVISILNCFIKLNCPTSNQFTGNGNLKLGYSTTSGQEVIMTALTNSSLNASSNQLSRTYPDNDNGDDYIRSANLPVILYKSTASVLGGNTTNDNTITLAVSYQIFTI